MSSILDMAVGGRISNPGKSVRGIFVNPANPEMLMGSAFAAVDQKNKRFKDPKSYAKAAQKEYQKQARSMKSDLSRSESAAFERLGKDIKRFEEQASMMMPSSSRTRNPKRGRTSMKRRSNPHAVPTRALALSGFAKVAKGKKRMKLDAFVKEAQATFKAYIRENKPALTEAGVLKQYENLAKSQAKIRDAAIGYASRKEDFTLTGAPKAKASKTKKASKSRKASKGRTMPDSYSKAADLRGSGKGGRILMRDIVRAAIDGDLSKNTLKAICRETPELAKYANDPSFFTKVEIAKYRAGKMTKARAQKLGIVDEEGRVKLDAPRVAKSRATRASKKKSVAPAKKAATAEKSAAPAKKAASKERKAPQKLKPHGGSVIETAHLLKKGEGNKANQVYRVDLMKKSNGKFAIDVSYGKHGGSIQSVGKKGTYATKAEAKEAFNTIVAKQEAKNYSLTNQKVERGSASLGKQKKSTAKKSTYAEKAEASAAEAKRIEDLLKQAINEVKNGPRLTRRQLGTVKGMLTRLRNQGKYTVSHIAANKARELSGLIAEYDPVESGSKKKATKSVPKSTKSSAVGAFKRKAKRKVGRVSSAARKKIPASTERTKQRAAKWRAERADRILQLHGKQKTLEELKKELEKYGIPSTTVTERDINQFMNIGYDPVKIEAQLKRLNAVDDDQFKRLANYAYQGGLIRTLQIPKPLGKFGNRFSNPGRRRYNPADYSQGGLFRGLVNDVEDGSLMGLLGQAVAMGVGFVANKAYTKTVTTTFGHLGMTSDTSKKAVEAGYSLVGLIANSMISAALQDTEIGSRYGGAFVLGSGVTVARQALRTVAATKVGGSAYLSKVYALEGYCSCDVGGYENFVPTIGAYSYGEMMGALHDMGGYEEWSPQLGGTHSVDGYQMWDNTLAGYQMWDNTLAGYDPAIEAHALAGYDPAIEAHALAGYDPALQATLPVFDGRAGYVPTADILYPTGYGR